ncbi:MAG: hypothetical protein R3F28_06855 [Candidatus Kapaibacterium sp.]
MPKRNHIADFLLTKVRTEEHFLQIPYFTWWFEYNRMEIVEPLAEAIPTSRWGEWEELVNHLPEVVLEQIQKHDDSVEKLRENCARLQAMLEERGELPDLYSKYMTPELLAELQTSEAALFGARWPDYRFSYLAQLIVNQTPSDCSPLYAIRPFWLRYGVEFLNLRKAEPYQTVIQESNTIVQELMEVIQSLDRSLTESLESIYAA